MNINQQDLNVMYNNWYIYKISIPKKEQERDFWEAIFKDTENSVKEKILTGDLDYILIQYIGYLEQKNAHKEIALRLQGWWNDVLFPHTHKCADVLHNYLSIPGSPTAAEDKKCARIEGMLKSQQWDNAIKNCNPKIQPQISWSILNFIMQKEQYTDKSWQETLDQLDFYLKNGGLWEENPPIPGQSNHIFLTPLAAKIAEKYDANKLNDLFKRGLHPNNMTVWIIPRFGKKEKIKENLNQLYSAYLKEILLASVAAVEKNTNSARKM